MNFLDGRLVAEEGRLWFVSGEIRVPLDGLQSERLSNRAGAPIVAGIRPQAIREAGSADGRDGHPITAIVHLSEVQGDRVSHRIETKDGRAYRSSHRPHLIAAELRTGFPNRHSSNAQVLNLAASGKRTDPFGRFVHRLHRFSQIVCDLKSMETCAICGQNLSRHDLADHLPAVIVSRSSRPLCGRSAARDRGRAGAGSWRGCRGRGPGRSTA